LRADLPTLQHITAARGSAILMTHLGRPKGDPKKDAVFKLDRVAERLRKLLGRPLHKVNEVVRPQVEAEAKALKPGEVLVLENLRFHPAEQAGDAGFAAQLAKL